ncbi:MAG: hypothetical protein U0527_15275 [Candidatus Eisenbacteria bacterium]
MKTKTAVAFCLALSSALFAPSYGREDEIGALLDRLSHPAKEVWQPAADALVAMGRSIRRPLEARRSRLENPRTAARFDSVLAQVYRLRVELSVTPRTLKVGAPVWCDVTLRNDSGQSLLLPLAADGVMDGLRAPRVTLEILAPDGEPASLGAPWVRIGSIAPLAKGDLTRLGDGESCSLFPGATAPQPLRAPGHWWWSPPGPGLFQLRVIYDTTQLDWNAWRGPSDEPSARLREQWSAIHRERVVSNWVSIHVIE